MRAGGVPLRDIEPILSMMLEKAILIATKAHEGQQDKAGAPYLLHLMRVMLKGRNEKEKICGILHDLVEDTPWTFDMLEKEGFAPAIIEALRCVTKQSEDEPYADFIARVKTSQLAIAVKIHDLEDNMDIRRMQEVTEKDRLRLNKYLFHYRELMALYARTNS